MSGRESDVVDAGTVPRTDVAEALGRVLSSPSFARSERSRAFLSYVVSESLAGRGERISERTVARGALGRGPSFDGLGDASVRVTATRVRRALDLYYRGEGVADPVRLSLPPGSYSPVVDHNDVPPRAAVLVPGVVVLTPAHSGEDSAQALAASTADALVVRLGGFDTLTVIGPTTARGDLADAGRRFGVSHVLDGRVVVRDGVLRLVAHLVSAADGTVEWSRTHDEPADGHGVFEVEDRWAREVAAQVADPAGIVLARAVLRAHPADGAAPELRARLAYYAYVGTSTKESIELAVSALDEALALGHRTAPLLAMRGAVANAAVLQGIGDPDVDTDLAERMAREALAIDAASAHAYLVLGGAARTRHHWTLCRQYAEEAARLTPSQPANVLSSGLLIASAGDWSAGIELMDQAFRLNPRLPVHAHLWLALGNVVLGRYDRALGEATLIDVDGEIFGPLYRALALSGLGHVEDARREVERILVLDPGFLDDVAERFTAQLHLADEQVTRIVGLLEVARPSSTSPGEQGE